MANLDNVIKDGATVANMPTVKFLSKISLGYKNETDSNHPIEYLSITSYFLVSKVCIIEWLGSFDT